MDDKLKMISEALAELEDDDFLDGIKNAIDSGVNPQAIVDACSAGIEVVGNYFEEGEYFVGDLVYSADLLKKGMTILEPLLSEGSGKTIGKVVIGTAKGDLHDIGKNIFASMLQAASFEVHDLGVDVPPERFVEKVKEVKPDIVGISGLLTLSINMMGATVKALEEAGVRDLKVMIGGNIVNDHAQALTSADTWCNNASKGVKQCKQWMGLE